MVDRTRLLSDNGSGQVTRAFGDYLRLVGIRHTLTALSRIEASGSWTPASIANRGPAPTLDWAWQLQSWIEMWPDGGESSVSERVLDSG